MNRLRLASSDSSLCLDGSAWSMRSAPTSCDPFTLSPTGITAYVGKGGTIEQTPTTQVRKPQTSGNCRPGLSRHRDLLPHSHHVRHPRRVATEFSRSGPRPIPCTWWRGPGSVERVTWGST